MMNCAIISDSRVCSNIDAERAKLLGARLAVFNELKAGEKLKTNEVQLLTGGDGFPAKALYKDPVTVMPRHLAIASGARRATGRRGEDRRGAASRTAKRTGRT